MPQYKGSKVLGSSRDEVGAKSAPAGRSYATQGPRTTDPKMVGKPTMSNKNNDPNNRYVRAVTSKKGKVNSLIPDDTKKPTKEYAKGGKIDGCAVRGKTKGRMV